MKIEQEFKRKPLARGINFHCTSEDTLHFTLALSIATVMYGRCAGACATLLTGVLARGRTGHGISTSIEEGGTPSSQPPPRLTPSPRT